jgi:ankyrin repeat protein
MIKRLTIMRINCLSRPWIALMLSVASLGAGGGSAGKDAPLADAVEHRDKQAMLSLLKAHADVNAPQSDGATALHWAAYLEDAETTALLIRAGAKVNAPNNYGVTPLALASANGDAAIIEQLLKAGADPNGVVRSGETPLMLATRSGQLHAVTVLLDAHADLNAKETWNGQTALMWAAGAGYGAVVQALVDHGADIRARSNSGGTPLLFAARHGDLESVRALLAAGADVNEKRPDGATPLLAAVINGHEDLVDLLLDKGADANVEGGSTQLTVQGVRAKPMPLKFRQLTNNERDSEGVARDNIWGKPLQAAVHVANWHLSDQFIAVKFDRLRVIKSLLAHGADVNGRITNEEPRWSGARYRRHLEGATALVLAAKAADVDVMRLLIVHGADPNINTFENITPLQAAAGIAWASNQDMATESQVLEAVKLLVEEEHADVNAVNDLGETAMHAAAYRGANSVVQYLFDKGAKLDVVAKDGRTPLIVADGVEYGNSFAAQPQTAVLLRKLGAKEMQCPAPCAAALGSDKDQPTPIKPAGATTAGVSK